MLAVWLLLSSWPLRWRWAHELCDICKTWPLVSRNWATIVIALAVPAALARERPPEARPAPRLAQAVQFAPVIEEFAAPLRKHTPGPYRKERRYDDESTTSAG
jgi:hypothetical protein